MWRLRRVEGDNGALGVHAVIASRLILKEFRERSFAGVECIIAIEHARGFGKQLNEVPMRGDLKVEQARSGRGHARLVSPTISSSAARTASVLSVK